MINNRKGLLGLNQLIPIIMLLVVLGITLTVGVRVNKGVQTSTPTTQTEALDAIKNSTQGLANIASNQGLLGTIIVFAVIISLVMVAFAFKGGM